MRQPSPVGTAIDQRRLRRWTARFGAYRDPVTNLGIESWLDQFKKADLDLAARVLDVVDFYSTTQIRNAFKESLASLDGWHINPHRRRGNWRFAAMSGSAGESGDMMLYQFRLANGLTGRNYSNLFADRSSLFRQPMLPEADPLHLGANDTVVLVDDFSGSGKQVCEAWNDPQTSFGALLAGVGRVFLVLVAGSYTALQKIEKDTTLTPTFMHTLHEGDNLFADKCSRFTKHEKAKLLDYCKTASRYKPRGFEDCGMVVVFQHRCPNNSIPILHASSGQWEPLFPRHDTD